ncbi:hypothetical protein Tco_0613292 [Tanacetum coccineum]
MFADSYNMVAFLSKPTKSDGFKQTVDFLNAHPIRVVTTASSLEAKQDSGNINKTQSKATPNESSSLGTTLGGGPSRAKKLEKKIRSRTHKLKRLYKVGLTVRVESFDNEEILGEDASKQGRIDAIDAYEEITLVSVQNMDEEMFDVNVLNGEC